MLYHMCCRGGTSAHAQYSFKENYHVVSRLLRVKQFDMALGTPILVLSEWFVLVIICRYFIELVYTFQMQTQRESLERKPNMAMCRLLRLVQQLILPLPVVNQPLAVRRKGLVLIPSPVS